MSGGPGSSGSRPGVVGKGGCRQDQGQPGQTSLV